jgi:hypothetical protein
MKGGRLFVRLCIEKRELEIDSDPPEQGRRMSLPQNSGAMRVWIPVNGSERTYSMC